MNDDAMPPQVYSVGGTLQRAIEIAVNAHREQKDRAGHPYILHPMRVMMSLEKDHERIVGILHDVVEDTEVTLEMLRKEGFDHEILRAIDHVTKREGEDYKAFIERVNKCDLARRVKLKDLEDNMDTRRLKVMTPKDLERLKKYHDAWDWLKLMSIKVA